MASSARVSRSSGSRKNPASKQDNAVTVQHFAPPHGLALAIIGGVGFYFVSFLAVRLGFLEPGTAAWNAIEAVGFPGGAALFRRLVDLIFVPVLAIHLTEGWWLDRSRLSKHGVARGGKVWWLWVVSNFFEGFTAFQRFDQVVRDLEDERKK